MSDAATDSFGVICSALKAAGSEARPAVLDACGTYEARCDDGLHIIEKAFIEDEDDEGTDTDTNPVTDTEDAKGQDDAEGESRNLRDHLFSLRHALRRETTSLQQVLRREASNVGPEPSLDAPDRPDTPTRTGSRACGRKTLDHHLVAARLRHAAAAAHREPRVAKLSSAI
jgi:hypothetical protein